MEKYQNRSGSSGVVGYQIGERDIAVYFRDGSGYLYDDQSAGPERIEQMKELATSGYGLNAYINRAVRKLYAVKIR
jgi:hypothetical protein